MLAWEPTDDDIEGMVFDALEALPAPFRDQLGSVAIVIEEEATRDQLDLVGAHGLYGLYQGVPADEAVGRRGADSEQDHDLPRTARPGQPDARSGWRRPSPTPSTTRSRTTSGSPTSDSTS